jgi:DME family drug/metabolite transporter
MTSSLLGGLSALFSALLWALSSVMFTWMAPYLDVLPMNLARCIFATLVFWLLLPFAGGPAALTQIAPATMLALAASSILMIVVGDSLYFASMRLIGVSRATPIASVNPLITLVLAIAWLHEHLTVLNIVGSVLTIAGLYLVIGGGRRADEREQAPPAWLGVVVALSAALSWGVGMAVLKVGVTGVDVIVAHSVRQPLGAVFLWGIIAASGRNLDRVRQLSRRLWLILFTNSIVANFIGGIFFVLAFQLAGAGKAATLTSTSPLFAMPFSILILRERPTRVMLAGTVLAVVGIALVV